jgi:hypothetical protein
MRGIDGVDNPERDVPRPRVPEADLQHATADMRAARAPITVPARGPAVIRPATAPESPAPVAKPDLPVPPEPDTTAAVIEHGEPPAGRAEDADDAHGRVTATGFTPKITDHPERPTTEWESREEFLHACIASMPAEWQSRPVTNALSAEEIQEHLRRERAAADAELDVLVARLPGDSRTVAIVLPHRWHGHSTAAVFRRICEAMVIELAKASFDVWIGVSVPSLLDLPTDLTGAVFYAIGLDDLRKAPGDS